jgi:hypothetical protein
MNVEIGAEAALFPEKQYINGIFVAVWRITERSSVKNSIPPLRVTILNYKTPRI